MSKKNYGKPKKEFAPTIKLWPSRNGSGNFSTFVSEKSEEKISEVLGRVEQGGMILLRPVSEKYKAKVDGTPPEFEIVVYTKAEVEAFQNNDSAEQADGL